MPWGKAAIADFLAEKVQEILPRRCQNHSKMVPWRHLEAPPGSSHEKNLKRVKNKTPPLFWEPFSTLGPTLGVPIFKCFLGTLPERLFEDFGGQKASNMEAFGRQFGGHFPKRENLDF